MANQLKINRLDGVKMKKKCSFQYKMISIISYAFILLFSVSSTGFGSAEITDPYTGFQLNSTDVTFTWNNSEADQYWLWIGTSAGSNDLYNGDQGTNTSVTVPGLPSRGEMLYARLWSKIDGSWHYGTDCTYTACDMRAEIQSPAPGSALSSTSQVFTWNSTDASQYCLWIGMSEGSNDLYNRNQGTDTSATVSGLPNNGETLYVRLWSKLNDTWYFNTDITYTACDYSSAAAWIQSPVPGSALSSTTETFAWNDPGAEQYQLWIGTSAGSNDIYNRDQGTNTSALIPGLPGNGETLYVRLWSRTGSAWSYNTDTIYTAYSNPAIAVIQSPAPGSVLNSTRMRFDWSYTGAEQYHLWIGTSAGGNDIYNGDQGTNLSSASISGLPGNGETLYVRLWCRTGSVWSYGTDSIYTAYSNPAIAVIQSPAPGSVLSSTTETFAWNNSGAEQYQLWIGTSAGSSDIYNRDQGTNTSAVISGLPRNGETLYVRLWSRTGSAWLYSADSICTAYNNLGIAVIQSPVPESALSSATETFIWNNSGAEEYWLWIGTSAGSNNLHNAGCGTDTSVTVSDLPNVGVTLGALYVRLWSKLSGAWVYYNDYTYYTVDTYTNSLGMTFKLIPAGTFMMGSPEDEPGRKSNETLHQVTLTQSYYMQTTETTQGQWESVMGSNPSGHLECGSECPVEAMTWGSVERFIAELNRMDEDAYRLPTEAEWEYAARAGSSSAFANGGITDDDMYCEPVNPNLSAMGWYCGNSNNTTHEVAQKQANAWGLYDMHGNVWEWCSDWYEDYPAVAVTDPTGPSTGLSRVLRGGAYHRSCYAWYSRSANRAKAELYFSFSDVGFRLVVSPSQQ